MHLHQPFFVMGLQHFAKQNGGGVGDGNTGSGILQAAASLHGEELHIAALLIGGKQELAVRRVSAIPGELAAAADDTAVGQLAVLTDIEGAQGIVTAVGNGQLLAVGRYPHGGDGGPLGEILGHGVVHLQLLQLAVLIAESHGVVAHFAAQIGVFAVGREVDVAGAAAGGRGSLGYHVTQALFAVKGIYSLKTRNYGNFVFNTLTAEKYANLNLV